MEQSICPSIVAHLILKILLEKACLGALQHTMPLDCTNCSLRRPHHLQPVQELGMGWAGHIPLVCEPTTKLMLLTYRCRTCSAVRGCSPLVFHIAEGVGQGRATPASVSGRAGAPPCPSHDQCVHTGLTVLTYGAGSGSKLEMTFSRKQQVDCNRFLTLQAKMFLKAFQP